MEGEVLGRQQNNIKGTRTDPIDPLLGSMMPVMGSPAGIADAAIETALVVARAL